MQDEQEAQSGGSQITAAQAGIKPVPQTFSQMLVTEGLPTSGAAATGLAVAGFALAPALAVGLLAGVALTALHIHAQS